MANLANDGAALEHAVQVLNDHASAMAVSVWQGERHVATYRRAAAKPSWKDPSETPWAIPCS